MERTAFLRTDARKYVPLRPRYPWRRATIDGVPAYEVAGQKVSGTLTQSNEGQGS